MARVPRLIVVGCDVGTMYCDVGELGSLATCGTAPFLVAVEYDGGAGSSDVLEFRRHEFPYAAE